MDLSDELLLVPRRKAPTMIENFLIPVAKIILNKYKHIVHVCVFGIINENQDNSISAGI